MATHKLTNQAIPLGQWIVLVSSFLVLTSLIDQRATFAVQEKDGPKITSIKNDMGFREHRAGFWSYINPEITNPTNDDREVEIVAFFSRVQNRQFAKRLLIPAKSKVTTSLPIFIPPDAYRGADIQLGLYDVADANPTLLLHNGKRSFDTSITIRGSSSDNIDSYHATSLIGDVNQPSDSEEEISAEDEAEELATASRIHFNQNGRIGKSSAQFLPGSKRAYESTDQLVISNDHLLGDSAGLAAVQRWLAGGGDIWIMLDLVNSKTVERILGETIPYVEVDQTSLTSVRIDDFDAQQASKAKTNTFEQPVTLKRVVVLDAKIIHTVNQWPASFWQRVNRGRVFYTTLGARAWMRKRTSGDPRLKVRLGITRYIVTDSMEDFGYQMYSEPNQQPEIFSSTVERGLVNRIGYKVLSRTTVITVLGIYTFLLFSTGILLLKKRKLEWLFYIGPVMAISAALIFLIFGMRNKASAPPTVASLQIVETAAGTENLYVAGLGIIYSPEKLDYSIGADQDGEFRGRTDDQTDERIKTVWNDETHWEFDKGSIEPGLTKFQLTGHVEADRPMRAIAEFTEQGLSGALVIDDKLGEIRDVVIASPTGRFLSAEVSGKAISIGQDDTLHNDSFVNSNLLSDQQRWHQAVYQTKFPADRSGNLDDDLTLYAWANPLDLDLHFPEEFRKAGGALLKMPLQLSTSPAGTKVTIPPALIDMQNVLNQNNFISPNYQNRTRRWLGSISPQSTTRLRFQLPPEVLPLKITTAVLTIHSITAPHRTVTFEIKAGAEFKSVLKLDEPTGKIRFALPTMETNLLDEKGGLIIEVGMLVKPDYLEKQKEADRDEREELVRETLEDIRLEVSGVVQERSP